MAVLKNPSFLYKSNLGVFYFQRRIPEQFRSACAKLPRFVRLSLATKHIPIARRLARALAVMLDIRQKQYFRDEESFHHGMKLLQEYLFANINNTTIEQAEEFLFKFIDDSTPYDANSLEQAFKYHRAMQVEKGIEPNNLQIQRLTELIETRFNSQNQNIPKSTGSSVTIDKAFDDFLMNKRMGWKKTSGMEHSYREVYFPIFKELVGNVETQSLTKSHTNEYINLINRLPANKSKKPQYRNLSIRDFLTYDVNPNDLLSPISKIKYLSQIGTFLRWLNSNDYTNLELDAPLKNIKIPRARSVDQQSSYTAKDLKKLFNSKEYLSGLHKSASHFWVPLVGIYTGARLNEICQLSLNDIYEDKETGRWVFDFNENHGDDPNKSLKKPHHARLVPVHKKLIALNFIEYIKHLKKIKHKRIFQDLPYVAGANKYGDKLQRWFNRTYVGKNRCDITTKNTSFHSLRHTVITHLVNEAGIDPNKIAVGMGQTPQGGVTQTVYTKTPALKDYIGFFDKINFDTSFDTQLIRRWNKHDFYATQLTTQHTRNQTDSIHEDGKTAKGVVAKENVKQDLVKEKVVVPAKSVTAKKQPSNKATSKRTRTSSKVVQMRQP